MYWFDELKSTKTGLSYLRATGFYIYPQPDFYPQLFVNSGYFSYF
jgi:hypothetical protein